MYLYFYDENLKAYQRIYVKIKSSLIVILLECRVSYAHVDDGRSFKNNTFIDAFVREFSHWVRDYHLDIDEYAKCININIHKKRQVIAAIDFLIKYAIAIVLEHEQNIISKTLQALKSKKEALLKIISDETKKRPVAYKHKRPFLQEELDIADSEKISPHIFATTNNHIYVFKQRHYNSSLAEYVAFAAQLAILALGPKHVANSRAVVNEFGLYLGVRSRKIENLNTLERLALENQLPSFQVLLKGKFIEALGFAFVFAGYDLHGNNIGLDANGNIILFDFDHWFYLITCKYHGRAPDKEHQSHQAQFPAPFEALVMTAKDIKVFPNVQDADPYWWLLKPHRYRKNILLPHLVGIEKMPEATYRAFRFFLKTTLFERSLLEEFARAHFRKQHKRKEGVEFALDRATQLQYMLEQMDEFKHFLVHNPQVYLEIIAEFEEYNDYFKEKNSRFRINLSKVKENLNEWFKSLSDLFEIAQSKLNKQLKNLKKNLEFLIKTYEADYKKTGEMHLKNGLVYLFTKKIETVAEKVQQWPNNYTAYDAVENDLNDLEQQLYVFTKYLDNIPCINKLLELDELVEEILRTWYLTASTAYAKEFDILFDRFNLMMDEAISNKIIFSHKDVKTLKTEIQVLVKQSLLEELQNLNKKISMLEDCAGEEASSHTLLRGIDVLKQDYLASEADIKGWPGNESSLTVNYLNTRRLINGFTELNDLYNHLAFVEKINSLYVKIKEIYLFSNIFKQDQASLYNDVKKLFKKMEEIYKTVSHKDFRLTDEKLHRFKNDIAQVESDIEKCASKANKHLEHTEPSRMPSVGTAVDKLLEYIKTIKNADYSNIDNQYRFQFFAEPQRKPYLIARQKCFYLQAKYLHKEPLAESDKIRLKIITALCNYMQTSSLDAMQRIRDLFNILNIIDDSSLTDIQLKNKICKHVASVETMFTIGNALASHVDACFESAPNRARVDVRRQLALQRF